MNKTVQKQTFANWSENYLDVLELLYGSFNLHPDLSIEELCQEWKEQFTTEKGTESVPQSRDIADWEQSYLHTLETLYGPMFVHPDLNIEEVNLEWLSLFRQDQSAQIYLRKVA